MTSRSFRCFTEEEDRQIMRLKDKQRMRHWKTIANLLKQKFEQHYTVEQVSARWRNHLSYQKKLMYCEPEWTDKFRRQIMQMFIKHGPDYSLISSKYKNLQVQTVRQILTYELKKGFLLLQQKLINSHQLPYKELGQQQLQFMIDYLQESYQKHREPIFYKLIRVLQIQTKKSVLLQFQLSQCFNSLSQFRQKIKQYITKSYIKHKKLVREWTIQEQERLYELFQEYGRPCGIIGKILMKEFGRFKRFKSHHVNGKVLSLLFQALIKLQKQLRLRKVIQGDDVAYTVTDDVVKPFFCKKNNKNFNLIIKFMGLAFKKKVSRQQLIEIHQFILKNMGEDKQKFQNINKNLNENENWQKNQ